MKTYVYLFFCLFSLMGFQACSNDEVDNVKTTTSNDVEAVSASSSLITSIIPVLGCIHPQVTHQTGEQ